MLNLHLFLFFLIRFWNDVYNTLNRRKINKENKQRNYYDMLLRGIKRVVFFSLQPKNCNFAKASLAKELKCPERESFNKCTRVRYEILAKTQEVDAVFVLAKSMVPKVPWSFISSLPWCLWRKFPTSVRNVSKLQLCWWMVLPPIVKRLKLDSCCCKMGIT